MGCFCHGRIAENLLTSRSLWQIVAFDLSFWSAEKTQELRF